MSEKLKVPLLDLKAQYATIKKEVDAAIAGVVESQHFILGPDVAALEEEVAKYSRVPHCIGNASGSDALLLALMALGVGPGDEVICPTYSFFATAGAISRINARIVFADIQPDTYNLCPKSLRDVASKCKRLKAIIPVHLYGQCADLAAIEAVAKEFKVPIIEDAAQAIGSDDAQGRRAGSVGAIGCFSFFPSKNLGGFGDGGMNSTTSAELAEKMKVLRVHGSKPKYFHQVVGFNSRLDSIQAAVLRVKLKHLDAWTAGRQKNAAIYDKAFAAAGAATSATPLGSGLALRTPAPGKAQSRHIYNQYVIRVPAKLRDPLLNHFKENNIGSEIYYPVPLHLQKCFNDLGYKEGTLPQSEAAAKETLALPIYPELAHAQLQYVADTTIQFVKQNA